MLSTERAYVMINHMVLTRKLGREQPAPTEDVSSGFQGTNGVTRNPVCPDDSRFFCFAKSFHGTFHFRVPV